MEEQKIQNRITYGTVAVLLIVIITIGATYAYFSAQAQTDIQTVTTGTLTMGFTNGDIVNADGIVPINDSEIETKATVLPFSVTNTGNQHTKITIKLTDITIDDALKDVDFRWGLYNPDKKDAVGTEMGVSFGIFKYSQTGGEEILLQDVILDKGSATKNYKLRIWVHDDGALQNEMQGKTFSAKVTVTGEAVEYTPEACFKIISWGYGTKWSIDEYDVDTCGTDVVIPKTINGGEVSGITANAFSNKGLTSVIIPEGIVALEANAFDGNKLTHITIPESIDYISGMFDNNYLESIAIPESVDSTAGLSNNNLKVLVIPNNNSNEYVDFSGNPNLTDIVLMEGLWGLNASASKGLRSSEKLTTIEIPSSVSRIGARTFTGNPNLTEIIVRGKTASPTGFAKNWNCVEERWDVTMSVYICTKYANVIFRP